MRWVVEDKFGRRIRMTEERWHHILSHSEMMGQEEKIKETIGEPELLMRSKHDSRVELYYRFYVQTPATEKYLLVAVKVTDEEGFVITSFFTDKIKKGERVWKRE